MKKIFTFAIALMSMFATLQIASATSLVFNVTVPTPTYQCWIIGNFCNWTLSSAVQCTKVDDTHYTVTLDDTTFPATYPTGAGTKADSLQYKYLSGNGDWAFNEVQADGSNISFPPHPKGGNRYGFTPNAVTGAETDVVAKWGSLYNPTILPRPGYVTIDVLTSDSVQVMYLCGNFNSWAGPVDSTKMTISTPASGGVIAWTKTVWVPDANTLQFNFCAGPGWDYSQKAPSGNFVFPVGTDIEMAVQVQYFNKIYDQSLAGTVNLKAIVPAGTDSIWIVGSYSLPNWSFSTAIKGTKNSDGTFSFVVPNVVTFQYDCFNKLDWNYKEQDGKGQGLANRTASYPADNNTTITVAQWLTTGLPTLSQDRYKVYTINNSIVVEGVTSQVSIFDVSGRKIQSARLAGKFSSQALKSGLYILLVDGATRKVAVN
jgi:hypothetical protein